MSSLVDNKKTGIVFDVQKCSEQDGSGARTVAFLKGCPLKCIWCSCPEAQAYAPELAYNRDKCLETGNCIRCLEISTDGAISKDHECKVVYSRSRAGGVNYADACPSGAFSIYGEEKTVKQVLDRVEEDELFCARSGRGFALSGGEPFIQPEFTLSLLREARTRRFKNTVETCGVARWDSIEPCLEYLHSITFDIKSVDERKHIQFTGLSNKLPLQNLRKIREVDPHKYICVRTPIVPGFNDSVADIQEIVDYLETLPGDPVDFKVIEFCSEGQEKYIYLGREYQMEGQVVDQELYAQIVEVAASYLGKAGQ